MTQTKCKAENPATCRYHGNRQLGVQAAEHIRAALAAHPIRYYLTEEQLKTVPLKKMTATALAMAVQNFAREHGLDVAKIDAAINLAADVHKKDLRTNRGRYPRTPYIEHPLRNTVRLMRYGCTDQATLIASVLHDTVEDHPFEISRDYAGIHEKDEAKARVNAFNYIDTAFGMEAGRVVRGMSNDLIPREASVAEKNKAYRKHVVEAIQDPQVCASKVSDLIDNGVGLYHNANGMGSMSDVQVARRATKYLSVWGDVEARLKRDVLEREIPVSEAGLMEMVEQLARGRQRLTKLSALGS